MQKILIVEDSQDVRENLNDLLQMNGYRVLTSDNGYDGIRAAIDELPDLIIADVMMPMINGLEMLRMLRENKVTQDIPLIFLSAKSSLADMRMGMNLGAEDYLAKPFKASEVLQAVKVRLGKRINVEQRFEKISQSISEYIPHELRTPLSAIIGFSNIILDEIDTLHRDELAGMIKKIRASSGLLHGIIEKFIIYSEAEIINSNKQSYIGYLGKSSELRNDLIEYIVREKISLLDKRMSFENTASDARLKIWNEHLVIMLKELIENALKFSDADMPVEISSAESESLYTLKIKNYGRGMTNEEILNTAPFLQHNRRFYEQGGTGLGLVICKRLTEFYGVKFEVSSVPREFCEVMLTFRKA